MSKNTIERYMTRGAGDNPEASHKPKRVRRESKQRATLRECVRALANLHRPLSKGWKVDDMADRLKEADAALAKAAAMGVTP